jgi:hypothetical protein
MYTVPFSDLWRFDRCVEADALFPWLVLAVTALILGGFVALFAAAGIPRKKSRLFVLLASVPVVGIVGVVAFFIGIFSCSAGPFWQVIRPAHELHAKMRLACDRGRCPTTAGEVKALDPAAYDAIARSAKITFFYDRDKHEYRWLVRPSLHYVALFSYDRYGVYRLASGLPAATLLGTDPYPGPDADIPR